MGLRFLCCRWYEDVVVHGSSLSCVEMWREGRREGGKEGRRKGGKEERREGGREARQEGGREEWGEGTVAAGSIPL